MRQSWHEDALASAAKNEVAKSVPPSARLLSATASPMDIPVESMKASLRSHLHDSGDQTSEIVS